MRDPSARFQRTSMWRFTAVCCILSLTLHVGADSTELNDPQAVGTAEEVQNRSDYLYENWKVMYGLDLPSDQSGASDDSSALKVLPRAPHLHDCSALEKKARDSDILGANGELPDWWGGDGVPQPPWIVGGEEENLPFTHTAQADIWRHQHPVNCSADGLRFISASWTSTKGHGLGSQIHVMTALLSNAVAFGRILVIGPHSFSRAQHEGCKGDHHGSLECYFRSMSKPECTQVVQTLLKEKGNWESSATGRELLQSDVRVVRKVWGAKLESSAALKWGTPWKAPATTDLFGVVARGRSRGDLYEKVQWWRSQGVRYLMRWPSPYLCHVTNNVRHRAMGRKTAASVASTEMRQRRTAEWHSKGKHKSAELGVKEMPVIEGVGGGGEAYMPRPIVSLHVRQGDKAKEMQLFSFATHMWMAERLRFHVPNLDHVWLSTEMESVVNEAKEYKEWNFLYSGNRRQLGATRMDEYEAAIGKRALLDASFANLLISAECDYFVGTLGSNWNRLINELRLTNGRFKAGYITLNNGEW